MQRFENLSVTAHQTGHFDGYRGFVAAHPQYAHLKCQAFAFTIEAEGKRIVYSGDLAGVEDIAVPAKGADLLVLEFGHLLPLGENLKRLAGLGIGTIVLTHIFPDYDDRREELQREADEVLPGMVTVARDFASFTV